MLGRVALYGLPLLCSFAIAACAPQPGHYDSSQELNPGAPISSGVADLGSELSKLVVLPSVTRPAETVNNDAARLIGIDDTALVRMLGEPGFVRRDAPAELWRYRNDTCVLDLFLYAGRTEPNGGLLVRHYEARALGSAFVGANVCFGRLLSSRAKQTTG